MRSPRCRGSLPKAGKTFPPRKLTFLLDENVEGGVTQFPILETGFGALPHALLPPSQSPASGRVLFICSPNSLVAGYVWPLAAGCESPHRMQKLHPAAYRVRGTDGKLTAGTFHMLVRVTLANTPGCRCPVIFRQGASGNRSQSMSAMHSARREGRGIWEFQREKSCRRSPGWFRRQCRQRFSPSSAAMLPTSARLSGNLASPEDCRRSGPLCSGCFGSGRSVENIYATLRVVNPLLVAAGLARV